MPTLAKRLAIVALDSSMAMMPLPAATMAWAVSASCSMLIGVLTALGKGGIIPPLPRDAGADAQRRPVGMVLWPGLLTIDWLALAARVSRSISRRTRSFFAFDPRSFSVVARSAIR